MERKEPIFTDIGKAHRIEITALGGADSIPLLLREAADTIERGGLQLISLDLQCEHAEEYGPVLSLFVRRG